MTGRVIIIAKEMYRNCNKVLFNVSRKYSVKLLVEPTMLGAAFPKTRLELLSWIKYYV
jgi:hypothetical protein